MQRAYDNGEPGIMFYDTMNNGNPLQWTETITQTNPCNEYLAGLVFGQELPPDQYGGACNLGSLMLQNFVLNPFTPDAVIDASAVWRSNVNGGSSCCIPCKPCFAQAKTSATVCFIQVFHCTPSSIRPRARRRSQSWSSSFRSAARACTKSPPRHSQTAPLDSRGSCLWASSTSAKCRYIPCPSS